MNELRLRCGDDVRPELYSYVRVLDENGAAISVEDSRRLDILLSEDVSGRRLESTKSTERGCIELPKQKLSLSLALKSRDAALSRSLDMADQSYLELNLAKAAENKR